MTSAFLPPSEMMFMRLPTLLACLAVSASVFVACRGGDDTNTPVDGNGSNGSGSFNKIQDVQNDAMPPGTAVSLHNVVVTAVDLFGDKKGDIWVEEMGGGKRSGIHVFNAGDQVQQLMVGDVIDLKGAIKSEFALTGSNADMTGRTTTELQPANGGMITITKLGMNSPITPDKVDALVIGQLYDPTMVAMGGGQAYSNAWEDWEGVLIELDNVSALAAPSPFTNAMPTPADGWAFNLTGVIKLEGTQADITMSNIMRGTCMAKTVGVVDYFYNYLLIPRSTADFATGGTGCPVAEATCDDGIDNDGNGFIDCGDFSCAQTAPSCSAAATVSSIQMSPTAPTGAQKITGAYVVAVSFNKHNMWIADNATAAAYQGVQIFGGTSADYSMFVVGSRVDVVATVQEFNDTGGGTGTLTELRPLSVVAATGTGTIVPVTGQLATTLTVDATGEPYEGVEVTLANVKIQTVADTTNHVGTFQQGATTFTYDDDIFRIPEGMGGHPADTCFASVTGIWSYDVYGNRWYFLPTADGTGTGTCN